MAVFKDIYSQYQKVVDDKIAELVCGGPDELHKSMMYSIYGGGKRLRPILFLAVLSAYGHKIAQADYMIATAIECIHTYSLIHDDLPCMDDDDERRGMPTNHIRFNEATALLAGDALLNFAYELILKAANAGKQYVAAGSLIAKNAGMSGMVGGQSLEFEETDKMVDENKLLQIYDMKCSKLISASVLSAVIISGNSADYDVWEDVSNKFGLSFQLKDDLLDEQQQENFDTLLKIWGREKAEVVLSDNIKHILKTIEDIKIDTEFISSLIKNILIRENDRI